MTTDHAAKLDRTLRFRNLTIGATAVPLPLALVPSALPQEPPSDSEAATDIRHDAETRPPADQDAQPQSAHPPPTSTGAAIDHSLPDAVVRSLQAAVDAVHDSLQQDAGGPRPILPQVASDAADIAARPVDGAPTQPSHAAPLPPVPASAGATPPAIVAMTAQHENQDAGIHHILPAAAAPVSHGLPQQPVNDVLSQANAPGAAPLPVVQAAAAAVQDVTAALESTLSGVVGVASGDSGAVTIPSLGGLGLDAIAGLLPPASAAPGPSHASDSVLASVEEVASFAAVGLPEVLHADQLPGHEVHSPLHLVGSGLL